MCYLTAKNIRKEKVAQWNYRLKVNSKYEHSVGHLEKMTERTDQKGGRWESWGQGGEVGGGKVGVLHSNGKGEGVCYTVMTSLVNLRQNSRRLKIGICRANGRV